MHADESTQTLLVPYQDTYARSSKRVSGHKMALFDVLTAFSASLVIAIPTFMDKVMRPKYEEQFSEFREANQSFACAPSDFFLAPMKELGKGSFGGTSFARTQTRSKHFAKPYESSERVTKISIAFSTKWRHLELKTFESHAFLSSSGLVRSYLIRSRQKTLPFSFRNLSKNSRAME